MDGKVKSRGRRSLVKRHRGSRLSVPLPAARRQRLESRLGSMLFACPTGADRSEPASLRYRPPDGRTGPERRTQREDGETEERRTDDGRKGQEPRSAVVGGAPPRQPAIDSGACCAQAAS